MIQRATFIGEQRNGTLNGPVSSLVQRTMQLLVPVSAVTKDQTVNSQQTQSESLTEYEMSIKATPISVTFC